MQRSLLAVVALLYLGVGLAQGDYIIIKVSMGVTEVPKDKDKNNPAQPQQPLFLPSYSTGGFMRPGQRRPVIPAFGAIGGYGEAQENNPVNATVFVEYSKYQRRSVNPTITQITHNWSKNGSHVLDDGKTLRVGGPFVRQTVFNQFDTELKRLKIPKERTTQAYFNLAQFAVTNGLVNNLDDVMTELAKLEPKEPPITAALKAYQKVKGDLANPPNLDDSAIAWSKLFDCKIDRSEHYCMLYDSTNAGAAAEAKGRLARLEQNMKSFYYWFALKGKVLPVPERRLVALLIEKPKTFQAIHRACGSPPLVADGFFARRDNIVVFSLNRLDLACEPVYRQFTQLIQEGWDLKYALDAKAFRIPPTKQGVTIEDAARVQTLAIIKRALDEESEIATASHQGTRQLLAAIDMLPRGVQMPEWIQFGFPSFFETPKSDPNLHTGAFWVTTGAPSWTHLVQFQVWDYFKELEPASDAVTDVVTDAYFRVARETGNPNALAKARTMSWALTYFLAQRHLDKLRDYAHELSLLPRDLEFDGAVHLGCFARAFDMADAAKPNGIDTDKLEKLGDDWYKFIKQTVLPIPELKEEAKKIHGERRKGAKAP